MGRRTCGSLEAGAIFFTSFGKPQHTYITIKFAQTSFHYSLQSQVDLALLLGTENGQQEDLRVSEAAGEEADALLGRQIRRLTAVVVKHVPNFWRLWLAIYSGRFAKVRV
jgi:exocyst complex component 2